MALKKPSDFFGNNKKTPLDEVKESYESARPEKIEQVSEAFDAFKSNLNHLQSLSDFTSTFDSFKSNLEKVESVSSEVSGIKEEIKSLIKKEDLDSAMMAQLLFVEESISKIESKVSSINGKTVDKIREDFVNLSTSVESFLDLDVPKYKKLISESEVRFDDRLGVFKEQVEENLDSIKEDVSKEVTDALETVESVNENTINIVKAEFKENVKGVNELVEKELPKYKKLFAETEAKTEEKINSAIHSYKSTIENLSERVKEFTEEEIPKYSNLLIETKLKSEKEVKQLEEEVLSRVKTLSEKVESLSEDVEQKTFERVESLQDVVKEYKEEIESISKRYETLQKDFTGRVVHEDKKLSQYSKKLDKFSKRFSFIEETLTEDVRELKENLETNTSKFYTELKSEIDGVEQNIAQTVKDLEVNIVINETHLKKQNEYIGNIQEEVKEVLDKLQLDVLEKKNAQLVERINHVEEVFSKINEKTLLTEDNPTLPGDPSTNNSGDPLTPLDQKFVTLDQLQNHYRTFINRIQQQIATIGGGGAGFIKDLDDVTFDAGIGTNKLLIYNGSKWVGIASTALGSGGGSSVGAGGTWATFDSNTGITTTKKVKIDDNLEVTGVTTSTGGFVGNLTGTATGLSGTPDITIRNITGVAATFTGILTYEDVTNIDSIGIITARSGIKVLDEGIDVTGISTFSGDVDIDGHTELDNVNVSGAITATTFTGNLAGTVNTATQPNITSLGTLSSLTVSGSIDANGSLDVDGTLNVSGVSTISTGVGTVHLGVGSTTLLVEGDTRVTGILTVGSSSLTLDGVNNVVNVGTALTLGHTQGIQFHSQNLHASGFDVNNINSSGIITASSFRGDGSQLTNIISGVGIQSASTRIGTGFTDINFTGAGITVVGSGTTLTVDIPSSTITRQSETSSGVTTDFTITGGYTVGLIDVFVNGVKQINGSDFTATDGSTVTMTPNVTDGDIVEFQKFDVAVTGSGGSGITTANIVSDSLVVSGVSTFSGNVNLDGDITSNVTITSTDTGSSAAPELLLYRNSASPDNGDYLGQIKFQGESDSGATRNYAKITGKISDATNHTEDGILEFAFIKAGSQNISARFKSTELMLLNGTDFSVDGDSTFTGDVTANGNIVGDNSTNISGINSVTATSFYGSGANLTGVISGVEIENNGTSVGTGITSINFSTNVTATASGGIATVTASGGGGGGSDGPSSVMMGMIF